MSDKTSNSSSAEPQHSIPLNDKKIINGWAMFDWANSSYALTIAVAIFPLYFNSVVDDGTFTFMGLEVTDTSLFSYSLSFAYLIIAMSLPMLTGIADYGGRKLFYMKIFTFFGSLACISLWFFTGMENLHIGVWGFIIAVIGFAGGQVFYNSYLPLIASEDQFDKVSAKGFTYGYIGSVILLLINLAMLMKWEMFGFESKAAATRFAFLTVGVWWFGFAQISFNRLPKDHPNKNVDDLLSKGFKEIKKVWQYVKDQKNIKHFLFSFFFYSAGAQTVIYLASTFATVELKFEAMDLILTILLLQFVAIIGAIFFSRLSDRKGNKFVIMIMLSIWIGICIAAYFVEVKYQFYIIAALVGLVMGGTQAISRSTYAKLIPEHIENTASYFSFYDVLEKVAIMLGTFSFGFIDQVMGGMRNSIVALSVFFIIGMLILATVKIKHGKVKEG